MASQTLWFYLEVDSSDAADPVKQRGPLAADDMIQLWKKNSIDDETYVWADGMADFSQIKQVDELKSLLMPSTSSASVTQTPAPIATPVSTISTPVMAPSSSITTWYYKNKQGAKLGPSVLDTLKIMWDFGEVSPTLKCLLSFSIQLQVLEDILLQLWNLKRKTFILLY